MPIRILSPTLSLVGHRGALREFALSHDLHLLCRIALLTLLFYPAQASAQTTYRDPNGSFSVDVPAGWHAENKEPKRIRVTISSDNATISFEVTASEDGSTQPPQEVLGEFEKRLAKACPGVQVVKRGDAKLAGLPGAFFQAACNDPKGGAAILLVQVATANGLIFDSESLSLAADYRSVKPVLDGIIGSFRLGVDESGTGVAGTRNQASPTPADPPSGSDAQRLRALEDACASGILSPDECTAKRAALTRNGNSSGSSGDNPKLQALERACKAGVFTPEECAAKRAALKNGGSVGTPPSNPPLSSSGAGSPRAPTQPNSANPPPDGTPYTDPHGAFRLIVPQGWTAKTKDGCYGPSDTCLPGSSGVNIYQGNSWAFVAPFSAPAIRPTDVVDIVARQYESQYQNLKMIQNEPQKFNGLDIALGQFTGVDDQGTSLSLVVVGIAAPNGQFYVACSSIALRDAPTAGPALSAMLQTLEFAGQ